MKGQSHHYEPMELRARRHALERQATALIKAADRRRRKVAPNMTRKPAPSPAEPRRLRLEDLAELRRQGRIP